MHLLWVCLSSRFFRLGIVPKGSGVTRDPDNLFGSSSLIASITQGLEATTPSDQRDDNMLSYKCKNPTHIHIDKGEVG